MTSILLTMLVALGVGLAVALHVIAKQDRVIAQQARLIAALDNLLDKVEPNPKLLRIWEDPLPLPKIVAPGPRHLFTGKDDADIAERVARNW